MAVAGEDEGGDTVDKGGAAGDDQDRASVNTGRVRQTSNGLHHDQAGDDEDGRGVGLGGEDRGAVVPEGALRRRRTPGEADGHDGEDDGRHVGDGVPRIGQQAEGVSEDAEGDENADQGTAVTSPTPATGDRRCRSGGQPRG